MFLFLFIYNIYFDIIIISMKKYLMISIKILILTLASFITIIHSTHAQVPTLNNGQVDTSQLNIGNSIGKISTIPQIFIFLINLIKWLGWVGVILGVFIAIFSLIFNLISTPSEKTAEALQGAITKAVIIVIAGILLLSVGFFISQIGKLVGLNLQPNQVLQ